MLTDQEHKARKGHVTGSSVGAILDLSQFMKRGEVMREMVREFHGCPREFTGNIATDYGVRNEAKARATYEHDFIKTTPGVFVSKGGWIGATPDAYVRDVGMVEFKCPYSKRDITDDSEFKTLDEQPGYYAQMQVQMYVTGRQWCHFYQWSRLVNTFEHVARDDHWLDDNIPKLREFHTEYLAVIADKALYQVHVDSLYFDMSNNPAFQKAEQEYIDAKARETQAKIEADLCKKTILTLAGDNLHCQSDRLIVNKIEKKTVNYKGLLDHEGVDPSKLADYTKTSTYSSIKMRARQ